MKTLIYAVLSVYVLWLFYLAVMNLKRAKDAGTIPRLSLWLGYPILIVGLVLDWLVNVVVFTVLFLELPGSATELVTGRLDRHYNNGKGWRQRLAGWFGDHLLHAFDPRGRHF
jgi:hypothetical protein